MWYLLRPRKLIKNKMLPCTCYDEEKVDMNAIIQDSSDKEASPLVDGKKETEGAILKES